MQVLKDKKIGIALGGGGARGYFHIGVLSVLEEYNIHPHIIAGTSMGSIIGALYAGDLSAEEIKQMAVGMDWRKLITLADIIVPLSGLIRGGRVTSLLKSIVKARTFAQLKKNFACVATDLNTGEQVVLNDGSLIEAVRASCSIPAIFTPVKLKGRYLIDGGLVNVVPVSVCHDMGADFVIGVNVIPGPREKVSMQEAFEKYKSFQMHSAPSENESSTLFDNEISSLFAKEPRLHDVVSQTLSIIEYRIAMENLKQADIAITPFNGNIGFWQFNRASDAINAGEISTRLALQRSDIARGIIDQQRLTVL
jgi:NTE family protein